MAQMESGVVDSVKDFNIGLSPNKAQYINMADLAVERRCWFRLEKGKVALKCGMWICVPRFPLGWAGSVGDGTDDADVIEFRLWE